MLRVAFVGGAEATGFVWQRRETGGAAAGGAAGGGERATLPWRGCCGKLRRWLAMDACASLCRGRLTRGADPSTRYDGLERLSDANAHIPPLRPWIELLPVLAGVKNAELFLRRRVSADDVLALVDALRRFHAAEGGRTEVRYKSTTGSLYVDVSLYGNLQFLDLFRALRQVDGFEGQEWTLHPGKAFVV